MKKISILASFIYLCTTLSAQETLGVNTGDSFVIEKVIYTIGRPKKSNPEREGRTKKSALIHAYGDLTKKSFDSQEALDTFVAQYQQKLIDSRYFTRATATVIERRRVASQIVATVEVVINDAAPFLPIPYVTYSSSNGLQFVLGGYLGNTGGNLFDTKFDSELLFPVRDGRLAWQDPNWLIKVKFDKIKAGPTEITTRTLFFDNRIYISDRGTEVYGYRSLELGGDVTVSWPFTDHWRLEGGVKASGAVKNNEIYRDSDYADFEFVQPARFLFAPSVGILYSNAPLIDTARKGNMARLHLTYLLSSPVEQFKLLNDVKVELKYGQFWRPTDYFFPSIIAQFYWKTGAPEFDMARFNAGIINNQWRGNGGFFINSSFLFRILDFDRVLQVQLGPIINYGIVLEPGRPVDIADQGFSVGATVALFFDQLPSVPFYITLASDLRSRHDNPTFAKRLEFSIEAAFEF